MNQSGGEIPWENNEQFTQSVYSYTESEFGFQRAAI